MTLTITPGDITNAEDDDAVVTPSFGLQTAHIIHAGG